MGTMRGPNVEPWGTSRKVGVKIILENEGPQRSYQLNKRLTPTTVV